LSTPEVAAGVTLLRGRYGIDTFGLTGAEQDRLVSKRRNVRVALYLRTGSSTLVAVAGETLLIVAPNLGDP
jgi:hypothetical protein